MLNSMSMLADLEKKGKLMVMNCLIFPSVSIVGQHNHAVFIHILFFFLHGVRFILVLSEK